MQGISIPSSEELDKSQSEIVNLPPDDYIVKVAKIDLVRTPSFTQAGTPNYSQMVLQFRVICLPVRLKSGDPMVDIQGKEVKPLTRWLFRNIDPTRLNKTKDGSPTFMRSFVINVTGKTDTWGSLDVPDFVLLDKEENVIYDKALREKYYAEAWGNAQRDLIPQGYKHLFDIRGFEGRYVAVTLNVSQNGKQGITRFGRLPASFVQPSPAEEAEAMTKFMESFGKKMATRGDIIPPADAFDREFGSAPQPTSPTEVLPDEVQTEDIPF